MTKATTSRTPWSSTRGQSLVEFALILPLLLVVAFIITEFGRALWIKNALTWAAGAGARAAIVTSASTYQQVARTEANRVLDKIGMGTGSVPPSVITSELTTINGTQVVHVTITRPFNFIPGGPLPTSPRAGQPFINLTTVTIAAESVMETQPGFGS